MSTRDRTILAALVLVVVAVGGYFLVVKPKQRQASHLQAQITTDQQSLTTAEQQVQQGLVAEREASQYQKQLRALVSAVPADAHIPTLINQLQAAADKSHSGFEAVSLGASSSAPASAAPAASSSTSTAGAAPDTASTGTFPSQTFNLQFSGTYFTVARLLGTVASYVHTDNKRFKASGRLVTISSVSFAAGSGGFPKVTATVTAVDYAIPSTTLTGAGS